MGYNNFSRFCYLGVTKWRFTALAHKIFFGQGFAILQCFARKKCVLWHCCARLMGQKMAPKTTSRDCFSGKKLVDLGNFGIALLAMCDTENANFEMQIGDFNRNLWQFWLVFRVILSIIANSVNISVENSSVEKYAVVRICTMARRSCNNSNQ